MTTITFSRQLGSGGDEIATQLCDRLGYRFFNKEMMIESAADVGLSAHEVVDFSEDSYTVQNFIARLFRTGPRTLKQILVREEEHKPIDTLNARTLNEEQYVELVRYTLLTAHTSGNFVIVGRGGQAILHGKPDTLHVRVIAPLEHRIQRLRKSGISGIGEIKLMIERHDRAAAEYLDRFFGVRWDDPANYHMVLNTGLLSLAQARTAVLDLVNQLAAQPVA